MERATHGGVHPQELVRLESFSNDLEDKYSRRAVFDERYNAFDEAFDGDHSVEYWLWNGVRLVPAQPDEVERIQDGEAWVLHEACRLHGQQSGVREQRVGLEHHRRGLLHALRLQFTIVLSYVRTHAAGTQGRLGRRS